MNKSLLIHIIDTKSRNSMEFRHLCGKQGCRTNRQNSKSKWPNIYRFIWITKSLTHKFTMTLSYKSAVWRRKLTISLKYLLKAFPQESTITLFFMVLLWLFAIRQHGAISYPGPLRCYCTVEVSIYCRETKNGV